MANPLPLPVGAARLKSSSKNLLTVTHPHILTGDSGSCANWYAGSENAARHDGVALGRSRVHRCRRALRHRGEVRAHPDRPVIALVGDGAMQMNMATLITIAKYWRQACRFA